ncbi:methyltransferase type 11 [Alkalispirochaeta sphaeroplastigenens]|uniref:Methyltransferase type 11 n=2 Tax=Alkalispirochaeta sphaeroplastigenens TaxID=1187066 RepID=A0A2S4JHB7_9SPIO|nr:methyltransferase type 11 [Alkalispirochaeta sphaeroplastigenens]
MEKVTMENFHSKNDNALFEKIFFSVYEELPRQGPGNASSAARALELCRNLPSSPVILDMGCGVGGQTIQLAELLPAASITAIDTHAPGIARLQKTVRERGLQDRIVAIEGDMADPAILPGRFDLLWSEGALYNLGLHRVLLRCYELLHPGGYLAFSDAIWRKKNPPPEVKASFDLDYPEMGWLQDDLTLINVSGLDLVGHFTLPDEAWWDDFYTPMETRIQELRRVRAGEPEALAVLDLLAREPDMHRHYQDFYCYEFFVARRPL